jgi:hypothetical protein
MIMPVLLVALAMSVGAADQPGEADPGQGGRGISLEVTPLSSGGLKTSQTTVTNVSIIQKLKIRVLNVGHDSRDLTLDCYFFSKPTTSQQLSCYDKSEKPFTVAAGSWSDFEVKSMELQTVSVARFTAGVRTEGWAVLVKSSDGKIVGFKTANATLDELVKDPDEFARVLNAPANSGAAPGASATPQPSAATAAASAPPQASPTPVAAGVVKSIKDLIFGDK